MPEDPQLFDTSAVDREMAAAAKRLKLPQVTDAVESARTFGGWALHKLEVLRLYLNVYRKVAGNGTYIDGFAGDGRVIVDGQLRSGSAAVALESGAFKTLLLYERPRNAKRLGKFLDEQCTSTQRARCRVTPGDFNLAVRSHLDPAIVPWDRPCFAFLDPNSTELAWSTIEALAAYKAGGTPPAQCKVELWILLNTYQVLMRLMPRQGRPAYRTLDGWFGERAAWRDLYDQRASPNRFAQRYAERLEDLGYGAAQSLLILDPKTCRPQYHMIHASDHPKAFEFMRWAERKSTPHAGEKLTLPGMTVVSRGRPRTP